MKKIISLILAITMFLSAGIVGATTAGAAQEENLCKVFSDDNLDIFFTFYGRNNPFSLGAVVRRAYGVLIKDPDSYEEVGTDTVVSKDYFNSLVEKLFELDKNFEEMVKDNPNPGSIISIDGDNYIIHYIGGIGGGVVFGLRGYIKNTDTYSVYLQRRSASYSEREDLIQFLVESYDMTEEEADAGIFTEEIDGVTYYGTWFSDQYGEMTVSYDGKYVKIISCSVVDSIPDLSDMITPESGNTPEQGESAKVIYDTCEGVTVYADDAFPAGTVVKVEKVTSGEIYNKAEKSLKGIAADGKIAVFEISAALDGVAVQPTGKVKVVFDLPSSLSLTDLKLYYVSEDGKIENVDITIDEENETVTAELEHFSTYALANTASVTESTPDNGTNPPTGDNITFILMIMAVAVISSTAVLAFRNKKKENK